MPFKRVNDFRAGDIINNGEQWILISRVQKNITDREARTGFSIVTHVPENAPRSTPTEEKFAFGWQYETRAPETRSIVTRRFGRKAA